MSEEIKEELREVIEVKLNPTEQLETLKRIAKECSKFIVDDTLDHLMRAGFKCIGAGWFSRVFMHSKYDNYVIKVCTRAEDSWPMYAKYCRDNKDNPNVNFLLPVIHEFIQIRSRGLYVAVLDRLERADNSNELDWNKLSARQLDQALAIGAGMQTGRIGHGLDYHCKQQLDAAFRHNMTQEAAYKQPEYKKAGRMIFDDLRLFCTIDLHGGNVMLCPKTGNIIVTDPVSYCSSKEKAEEVRAELDPSYKPEAQHPVLDNIGSGVILGTFEGHKPTAQGRRRNVVLWHDLDRLGFDGASFERKLMREIESVAKRRVDNIPKLPKLRKQPSARHRHQCTFIRQKIHKHKRF